MTRHYGQDLTGRKPVTTFEIEEGNFTRNENMTTDQGPARGGSFTSQLYQGDEVQVYVSTDVDDTVTIVSSGIPIGRIATEIVGDLPKSSLTSGNFPRRKAGIELDGDLVRVKLVHDNAAVQAGDYLAISSGHKNVYNKEEDTTSNLIALQHAGASSGKYIRALRRYGQSANEAD